MDRKLRLLLNVTAYIFLNNKIFFKKQYKQ